LKTLAHIIVTIQNIAIDHYKNHGLPGWKSLENLTTYLAHQMLIILRYSKIADIFLGWIHDVIIELIYV